VDDREGGGDERGYRAGEARGTGGGAEDEDTDESERTGRGGALEGMEGGYVGIGGHVGSCGDGRNWGKWRRVLRSEEIICIVCLYEVGLSVRRMGMGMGWDGMSGEHLTRCGGWRLVDWWTFAYSALQTCSYIIRRHIHNRCSYTLRGEMISTIKLVDLLFLVQTAAFLKWGLLNPVTVLINPVTEHGAQ